MLVFSIIPVVFEWANLSESTSANYEKTPVNCVWPDLWDGLVMQ